MQSLFTYTGSYDVKFSKGANQELTVTIDTDRLYLRPVNLEDTDSYATLFSNQKTATKVKTKEEVATQISKWIALWKGGDPFSALTIFDSETDAFLGYTMLGHGSEPGEAELTGLCVKNQYCKGLGTEVTTAIINGLVPALIREGYQLQGKPLEKVTAMANPANSDAVNLLTNLGMVKVDKNGTSGNDHFGLTIKA